MCQKPGGRQMPDPRAVPNLLMPHPRDWQGTQMSRSCPGGGGWAQLELTDALQRVLNRSARPIYSTSKFEHVTPLLLNPHWLPVDQRIIFKVALVTFKAVHDAAPSYITELLRPYKPSMQDTEII